MWGGPGWFWSWFWFGDDRRHEQNEAFGRSLGEVARRRPHFRYSRWDGTQVGFDLDADAVLSEINDDLLYHGDLNAALRRMLNSGFADREGRQVEGMRDLLEKLRR